jgi:hypothetical protein
VTIGEMYQLIEDRVGILNMQIKGKVQEEGNSGLEEGLSSKIRGMDTDKEVREALDKEGLVKEGVDSDREEVSVKVDSDREDNSVKGDGLDKEKEATDKGMTTMDREGSHNKDREALDSFQDRDNSMTTQDQVAHVDLRNQCITNNTTRVLIISTDREEDRTNHNSNLDMTQGVAINNHTDNL